MLAVATNKVETTICLLLGIPFEKYDLCCFSVFCIFHIISFEKEIPSVGSQAGDVSQTRERERDINMYVYIYIYIYIHIIIIMIIAVVIIIIIRPTGTRRWGTAGR